MYVLLNMGIFQPAMWLCSITGEGTSKNVVKVRPQPKESSGFGVFFCIASRVLMTRNLAKATAKLQTLRWDIIPMKSWLIHRKSSIMDYEMFPEYNRVGFHPPKNTAYIPRLLFGQSFSHKPPFITSSLSSLAPWCLWGKSASSTFCWKNPPFHKLSSPRISKSINDPSSWWFQPIWNIWNHHSAHSRTLS